MIGQLCLFSSIGIHYIYISISISFGGKNNFLTIRRNGIPLRHNIMGLGISSQIDIIPIQKICKRYFHFSFLPGLINDERTIRRKLGIFFIPRRIGDIHFAGTIIVHYEYIIVVCFGEISCIDNFFICWRKLWCPVMT